MTGPKPLKSELHHWWPRTLAEYWRGSDGLIGVARPDGSMFRSKPKAIGAITNAHHIKLGGPWDSTFEPIFGQADSQMTNLVCWLLTLETSIASSEASRLDRILAQDLPDSMLSQLARSVASLLARSPRTRDEIRRRTAHYRTRFGFSDPEPEDHLIAFNQRGLYDAFRKRMESSGRWAVLFTDTKEFIFGDGFLHNFAASADDMMPGKKCIVPLTPTIAAVYMSPISYPSDPKLVTIKLDGDEVQFLNDALQAYANQFLFFRSQEPTLTRAFTDGQYRQFKFHAHEWLEGLMDDLSQYNLWGPGRTPSRSEGQFLRSFQENEQFDALLEQWRKEDSRHAE